MFYLRSGLGFRHFPFHHISNNLSRDEGEYQFSYKHCVHQPVLDCLATYGLVDYRQNWLGAIMNLSLFVRSVPYLLALLVMIHVNVDIWGHLQCNIAGCQRACAPVIIL